MVGARDARYPVFGCGGLHPWSELIDGTFVIKCPNRANPGVLDNAQKALEKYRADLRGVGKGTPRGRIW
jgi:hypothetical protein